MDGSINSIETPSFQGWIKMYNLTFIVGIAISFTVMSVLCYFFPPPGLGVDAPFVGSEDGEYYVGPADNNASLVDGVEFTSHKVDGDGRTSDGDEKTDKGFVEQF